MDEGKAGLTVGMVKVSESGTFLILVPVMFNNGFSLVLTKSFFFVSVQFFFSVSVPYHTSNLAVDI